MPGNRKTRWFVPIYILIAVVAAVVGLTIGVTIARFLGDRDPLAALVKPTVSSPTLTPTAPPTVVQIATSTISPTSVPSLPTSTPRSLFEGPFSYGSSFGGRPLLAYRLGTGPSARAIIGGIHGGYEWNTVALVSETLKYLQANPALVPDGVTLYLIPCANPDGYAISRGLDGRTNGNTVDLNRNWDYQWQPTATHGTRPVNAGAYAFSEPETAALRDLILEYDVEAAIFYHSAMAQIFYGADRSRSATYDLAVAVSQATGYPIADGVPGQITTGDAIDWMSIQGLAGIKVELSTHEDIEWERNLRGLRVFLDWIPPSSSAPVVQTTQIGTSVQGRPLEATQVGSGSQVALVVIGNIHGDEVHTEALVRGLVPSGFTLYFMPTMNPDGLAAGTRDNANGVDLNRNWPTDDWQTDAARTRGIVPGSGGTAPGSEPEVQAVSHWLLDTVKPAAREVWLLSYHAAYPPDGGVQPGYTVYGTPSPQADPLARRVAELAGYTYLPTWPTEYPFTGELIHWCDVNGIWAAEVELPSYDSPDTVIGGKSETALATHQRVLGVLLAGFAPTSLVPGEDGYIHHIVQPGEVLSTIAEQYGVAVEDIMLANGIVDADYIAAGQEILIPVPRNPE